MAFSNFIPEIWSARLLEHMDKVHVYANLMNRDYEGDIKAYGDTVHINLLGDELLDAEGELLLYLGWEALDETLMGKAVELAALYYQQDRMMERGYRSRNYSEGQVSQSDSYLTPDQMRETAEELFRGLARYRRVTC